MPQFNWSVFGPILFVLALLGGGSYLLVSHVPHSAAHSGAVQPAAAATVRALQTPAGVRLNGHVDGTPHLRANPSSNAIVLQDLQSGEAVDVTGCSDGCAWYLVALPNRPTGGWVPSAFVEVQGDDHRLPVQR